MRRRVGLLVSGSILLLGLLSGCEEEKSISYIAWSPDGRFVAFSVGEKIYLTKPLTASGIVEAKPLVEGGLTEGYFAWASYGDEIYFAARRAGPVDIYKVRLATREVRPVTRGPAKKMFPAIDRDDSHLAYVSYASGQSDLYLLDLDTSVESRLTADARTELSPVFSPDGRHLVYVSARSEEDRSIEALEVSSRQSRTLVKDAGKALFLKFSPDGKRLGYVSGGKVFVLDWEAAAQAPLYIADGTDFAWGKDSAEMFLIEEGNLIRREIHDPAAGEIFIAGPGREQAPAVSPDGRFLAFATGVGPQDGRPGKSSLLLVISGDRNFHRWVYLDPVHLASLVEWCKGQGWYEDALWAVAQIEKEKGTGGLAHEVEPEALALKRAEILLKMSRPKEAARVLEASGSRTMELVRIYLFQLGEVDRARALLDKVAPDEEAATIRKHLKELQGENLKLYIAAKKALEEGQPEIGAKKYEDFIRRLPKSTVAEDFAYELGLIYLEKLKRPKEAYDRLGEAILKFPNSPHAFHARIKRAESAESLGWFEKAFDEYARAAEVAGDDLSRLQAIVGGVSVTLEHLKDVERAYALAREALSLKIAPEQDSAALQLVEEFDRAGLHREANSLLAELIDSLALEGSEVSKALEVLRDFGPDAFAEVRLESIPEWFPDRVNLLARSFKEPEGKIIAFGAAVLLSQKTSEGLLTIWQSLRNELSGQAREKMTEFEKGLFYAVANTAQNEGNLDRAFDYYARLAEATDNEPYLQTLRDCQELLQGAKEKEGGSARSPQEVELLSLLREFLDVERRERMEFWGKASDLYAAITAGSGGPDSESGPRFDWGSRELSPESRDFYLRLLEEGPETLRDNARYRLLSRGPERWTITSGREEGYPEVLDVSRVSLYAQFLRAYVESEYFGRAFEDMIHACRERQNFDIALEEGKKILLTLREEEAKGRELGQRIPDVLLEIGRIYGGPLRDSVEAETYLRQVTEGYPESHEWPEAEWSLSLLLLGQKKNPQARKELTALMERRGDFREVKSGEALKNFAASFEAEGNWVEAEKQYLVLFEKHPKHPEVEDGSLLLGIYPNLSDVAKRTLWEKNPEALRRIVPKLSDFEKEKLFRLVPELRPKS